MLSKFRQSYPNGSLISDLLTIHEGKYLVRVIVRVDGEPLATGLAAEDKLELAEDRARQRAIEALEISQVPAIAEKTLRSSPTKTSPVPDRAYVPRSTPSEPSSNLSISHKNQTSSARPSITDLEFGGKTPPTETSHPSVSAGKDWSSDSAMPTWKADESFNESFSNPSAPPKTSWNDESFSAASAPSQKEDAPSQKEDFSIASVTDSQATTPLETSEFPSQDYAGNLENAIPSHSSEDVDNSDILAQTDMQMRRLGWDAPKGRAILKDKYDVASRRLLNPEQLVDFLNYLKSQPDPL
ncbi:MAG: hypothetical protein F6J93_33510 [Oscillatoria sp. SIO1A7]|nr:hypothetical protein [Oscillatoria sp. SIO1A7]